MNDRIINDSENSSAIILSAGKSERFGEPKALLPFDETNSFLQKLILEYFKAGIKNIIVVINKDLNEAVLNQIRILPTEMSISIIDNANPEAGRFSSIKLAADFLETNRHAFIQNIDNPFTSSDLIMKMLSEIKLEHYVVPIYNGENGHPVFLSNSVLQKIRALKSTDGNLREVLKEFSSIKINTEDANIHANINIPEDYLKYFNHAVAH